MRNIYRKI